MAERKRRGDGFSEERKSWFILALRKGESVLGACALVGISNRTAYNHRDRDPEFARAWDLARSMSTTPLELAAFERGVEGIEEPVYAYGKKVCTRRLYSNDLLICLLKAEQPRKYGPAAGLRSERRKLRRRVDERLAAEIGPLRAEVRALRSELEALQTLRNSGGGTVNFMNPTSGAEAAAPRTRRGGKSRGGWRLAAAQRRFGDAEISRFPRSP